MGSAVSATGSIVTCEQQCQFGCVGNVIRLINVTSTLLLIALLSGWRETVSRELGRVYLLLYVNRKLLLGAGAAH